MTAYTFDQIIDYTRTSAATYVANTGFVTQTPASRNLLIYTQEFDNAAWGKNNVTITANSTTAPDGTTTADTFNANGGSAATLSQSMGSSSSGTYTASIYAKAGTKSVLQFSGNSFSWGSDRRANFDLANGVLGTVDAGFTATITAVGNGWYRCTVTGSKAATAGTAIFCAVDSTTAAREATATAGTIFIWGAQGEFASAASTYTRNVGGLYPPRFDYDPVTLAPRGLLIEEQRTNLLTYSEQFDNAAWSRTNITVTAAAATSPDGTVDAQKIEATATAATSIITPTATVAATAATFSVYVKQGTGATTANIFTLRNVTSATNLIRGTLNYSTGAFTYTTGSTGVTVTNVGNGWWRIVMTATSGITSGDTIRGYVGFDGGSQTAGDHLFAWGAQLEAVAFATSYIPTVASQVTRTADVATVTGANFSRWYNQSEGTLLVEATTSGDILSSYSAAIVDTGVTNIIGTDIDSSGAYRLRVTAASVNQALVAVVYPIAANTTYKLAGAYRVNDFAASANGGPAGNDTSGTVPTGLSYFAIGSNSATGASSWNGHIRRIRYYPTRLSNAQLQALTA